MRFCMKTCMAWVARVGQETARLHGLEVRIGQPAFAQRRRQDVRGRDRILDREIDADAADRRHGVRGIADAEHAGPPPGLQAVDADGQQLQIVDARQLVHAIADERHQPQRSSARNFSMPPARTVSAEPLGIT